MKGLYAMKTIIERAYQQLKRGGYIHVLSMNVILQIAGFGSILLIAGFLGPSDLAIVKTTQAYAAVLLVISGAGLTAPVLRYCADLKLSEGEVALVLITSIKLTACTSILVLVCILSLVVFQWDVGRQPGAFYLFYALVLPGVSLTALLFVFLQARQKYSILAKNQTGIKLFSIGAILVGTYGWGLDGFLVATITTTYAGLMLLLRISYKPQAPLVVVELPKEFYRIASFSMAGMLITTCGQSSDYILLDFFDVSRTEVGKYSLATIFYMGAATVTASIQTVITPKFTALIDSPKEFIVYLQDIASKTTAVSIAISAFLLLAAAVLQEVFFGESYKGYLLYLFLLLAKYVIWSIYAVFGAAMLGAGIYRPGIWISCVSTCVCFLTGYPLVQEFGAIGAAGSQILTALLTLILIKWVQQREFEKVFISVVVSNQKEAPPTG